jgi:hypothetical protein
MALTALITLTTAGSDTGPFDLYSNIDGFLVPFESGVSKLDLEAGYISYLIPDSTITVRVQSTSVLCPNYIDLVIEAPPSTTTSTSTSSTRSTSSTTSTTTTFNPAFYDFYLADAYSCIDCSLNITNTVVCFPTGSSITIGRFYLSAVLTDYKYQVTATTSSSPAPILSPTSFITCAGAPCVV